MTATFFTDADFEVGAELDLSEDAAHHARVRRLTADEPLRLTNGRGSLADASLVRLDKKAFRVVIDRVASLAARPSPISLFVPVGDRDRTLWLAEKATELQVTRWIPVLWSRSRNVSPRAEGESFTAKVRARMISALEQSGGAWMPSLEPQVEPGGVDAVAGGSRRMLLDVDGAGFDVGFAPADGVAIALGPEGGLTPPERAALIDAGWTPWKLGSTTLRFETAAVAAVAVVRAVADPSTRSAHG